MKTKASDVVGDLPNVQYLQREDYEAGLADMDEAPGLWQRFMETLLGVLHSLLSAPFPR